MRARGTTVTAVAAALLVVLAACTEGSDGRPSARESSESAVASRDATCTAAVRRVVEVTQRYVDGYAVVDLAGTPGAASTSAPTASANPTSSATPGAKVTDADLQAAVEQAQRVRRTEGCQDDRFRRDLESGLAGLTAKGAVASAVLRQIKANLTGRVSTETLERSVTPDDDLAEVLAEVGPDATVLLGPGTYRLDETLVLLRGTTLRGAGRGRTTIVSTAADAAVLVLTGDRVVLEDLAVRRTGAAVGSVLIGGSAASLLLSRVELSGARIGNGDGGAGLLMTAASGEQPRSGTTREATDAQFANNEGAGIALTGSHRASIVSSVFRRNRQCGVCFLGSSGGAVRQSTFAGNGAGVAVTSTSRPLVEGNRISAGQVGVQAVDDSAPVLKNNTISGAARAAVIWSGRAGGRADGTRCRDVSFGLVVGPKAHPFLGKNACAVAAGR
jgi:parallel beta-helix repeat protein